MSSVMYSVNMVQQTMPFEKADDIISRCVQENTRVIVRVTPSRSGMSRRIRVKAMSVAGENAIYTKDITLAIASLLGLAYLDDGSVRVSGCGADMVAHTLYAAATAAGFASKTAALWSERYETI